MCKSLVTLNCSFNELKELPDSISNLENLEELVISHNHILRLPSTMCYLRNLRYCFVDENQLRLLPDEICGCRNLRVLTLSRNYLIDLPQNIGHLDELKVLNVVNNNIKTLPVSVLCLKKLTSLWISDNQSQPLVPLQFLDSNDTTQLTCFMLPQSSLKLQQSENSEQCNLDNAQYMKSQPLEADATKSDQSMLCVSNSRRICFAEETTILSASDIYSSSIKNKQSCILYKEQLGRGRLMRTPTPFPKELRKYIKNNDEHEQNPLKLVKNRIQHAEQVDTNSISPVNRYCETTMTSHLNLQQANDVNNEIEVFPNANYYEMQMLPVSFFYTNNSI